ncbi:MAG TPA: DUF58 domain-containing protein, partial [Thermoanaerobaculia bacterium]|nr:DUF58 domain-containing protein [Thermoanaerobaculia bacterium]
MNLAPTQRGLALVAAGVLVAAAPAVVAPRLWPVWVAYAAAATVALAADGALAPRRRDLAWDVAVPDVVPMAEESPASVALELPGRWPRGAVATLDLSELLEPVDRAPLRLEPVPGPGSAGRSPGRLRGTVRCPLVPRRRGRAEIERLWLRLPGPLGLMERTAAFDLGRRLEVRPNVARVRQVALRFTDRRDYLAGLKIERYTGDGTDFEALREFVPGNDPRGIDWKATARHRRLLCREFRAERNHQVVLALDTGRLMGEPLAPGPGRAPAPRLDHAIHAALLVAYVALKSGDRVGLYAFDEEPRAFAAPRAGVRAFHSLLALTADLDYGDAETNFTLCLTQLAARLERRTL